MTLALHLSTQLWPLLDLILAIFQPAMVLLLCAGFVFASIHLLTMLGTRWGDRRVSSKSLFFSMGLHLTLLCGVIAMIPEYRPRMSVTAFQPDDMIQVGSLNEQVQTDLNAAEAELDGRPIWDKIDAAVVMEPERTEIIAPEPAPAQLAHVQPDRPDQPIQLPELDPSEAVRQPAETSILMPAELVQQSLPASLEIPLEAPQHDLPAVPARSVPRVIRSDAPRGVMTQEQAVTRIDRQPPHRLEPDYDPEAESLSIAAMMAPDATIPRGLPAEAISRREGPAPYQISQDTAPPATAPGTLSETSPSAPSMARSVPRGFPSSIPAPLNRMNPVRPRPVPLPDNITPGESIDLAAPLSAPVLMHPDLSPQAIVKNATPAQYLLRNNANRGQAIQQFGGSTQSEAAVDLALKWLASIQEPNGSFDGDSHGAGRIAIEANTDRDGRNADAGLTALAVLAFLGKQHTLEDGPYSANVEKALRWLVSQQGQNSQGLPGYLGGQNASNIAGMYSHALATFAIAEAYAMTKDQSRAEFLKLPLQRAVQFTIECQLSDGGWRYMKLQKDGGDMSIFGWQLMSLKSAQAAGIDLPLEVRQKMIQFLQNRGVGPAGGLAKYRPHERAPSVAMTAEALFCKQMLGISREHPSCTEAVDFILANPPTRSTADLYSWYYSTLALYQYGGEPWEKWNGKMRDLLVNEQTISGPLAGSWEPRDRWGGFGGRIYSTTFATLTLEVYYRYLPLYQLSAPAGSPPAGTPQEAEPRSELTPVLEK
ncbi:MAG: hypothetical protein DWH91_19445 [Planctomycetota bacterium]|nr:MAG: hypothetical protein DWH91_19445 [Planctomycetota bacterium]